MTVLNENGEERLAPTEWLRAAIAPLAAGARQELLHPLEDTAPIAALDVQTAFLFTLPMVALQPKLSGSCTLAVDLEDGVPGSPAGVTVRIEQGQLVSCETYLDENADAWAAAPAAAWLDAVIEGNTREVRWGGDWRLTGALLKGLHKRLFGASLE